MMNIADEVAKLLGALPRTSAAPEVNPDTGSVNSPSVHNRDLPMVKDVFFRTPEQASTSGVATSLMPFLSGGHPARYENSTTVLATDGKFLEVSLVAKVIFIVVIFWSTHIRHHPLPTVQRTALR